MIKEVFKLKKNSWHVWLMKKMWKLDHTDFPNMCPYTWLTVLNVVIAIPFVIIKTLVVSLYWLSTPFVDGLEYVNDKLEARRNKCDSDRYNWLNNEASKIRKALLNNEIHPSIEPWLKYYYDDKKISKLQRSVYLELNSLEIDLLLILANKREDVRIDAKFEQEKLDDEAAIIKAAKPLNKTVAKYAKFTKWFGQFIVVTILVTVGIFAAYYIGLGAKWLALILWNANWLSIAKLTGVILLVILAASILGVIVYYIGVGLGKFFAWLWCKYNSYCEPCEKRNNALRSFFNSIGRFFIVIFSFIWSGFVWFGRGCATLWDIFMALKADNCPAIDWE